jgi:hypothetical protein
MEYLVSADLQSAALLEAGEKRCSEAADLVRGWAPEARRVLVSEARTKMSDNETTRIRYAAEK